MRSIPLVLFLISSFSFTLMMGLAIYENKSPNAEQIKEESRLDDRSSFLLV